MAARDNERMVFFSQQTVKSLTDTSVFKWMTGQPEALISGGGTIHTRVLLQYKLVLSYTDLH